MSYAPLRNRQKSRLSLPSPFSTESAPNALPVNPKLITWSGVSLCGAAIVPAPRSLAISGLRVAIGLSALAAAAGIHAPAAASIKMPSAYR